MLNNIPAELRALAQWVVADKDKLPYSPRYRTLASVNDPQSWGTFEEAAAVGAPHIGFVLTPDDPYAFIDLDQPENEEQAQRHQRILNAFDSYAEISQSGNGVHIIVKGTIPHGTKRDHVELYSAQRYAIFTGNVIKSLPIADYQGLLTRLYEEMQASARPEADLVDKLALLSDDALMRQMCNASNGAKAIKLCRGEWQGEYPSQSEADFALLSIISFYSGDNEQVRRVFRLTGLGQRSKATRNDDYLNRALRKIRASELPRVVIDLAALRPPTFPHAGREGDGSGEGSGVSEGANGSASEAGERGRGADVGGEGETGSAGPGTALAELPKARRVKGYTFPPGVIGCVAEFMLAQAIRPVPEVALAGALAFVSGIIGRSYNISGAGLNQYLVLIANTGSGKEAAASGINKLFNALRPYVPAIDQFQGPGVFASGQALTRVLDDKPCFVSTLGEFGLTLQQWSNVHANPHVAMMRRMLLDLYSKSGAGQVLHPSVYSDKDKNTKLIQSPCVTILGESTPEHFFDQLSVTQISEGLIPRFSVIEYKGERPARNRHAASVVPSDELKALVSTLAGIAVYTLTNNSVCNVVIDDEAHRILDEFDAYADSKIRDHTELERQLWNRAHLKALKLAGLIAAADAPHSPVVTAERAQWAVDFIGYEIENIADRFNREQVGSGEQRFEAYIREAMVDFMSMTQHQRRTYKVPEKCLAHSVVPFSFLRRRARRWSAFATDRRGPAIALRVALDDLCNAGIIVNIPPMQARAEFGTDAPLYAVGPSW